VCGSCQEQQRARLSDSKRHGVPEVPQKKATPKKRSKWHKEEQQVRPGLETLPFTQRTSGWCTDYNPSPEAVHERCDGDLGKYRCPCYCHGWKDSPEV